jgi:hypothetical protein
MHSVIPAVRAFGVAMGPAAVADGLAAASVVSTARSLARRRRPKPPAVAGTVAAVAYAALARPWMRRHLEVEIDAPPEAVWPWLAQLGQDRAGFYSYDWLENLAGCEMHSADRIHPEWQHREVGETLHLHPLHGMPVTRFEPGRALGIDHWGTFVLEPLPGGGTRLREEPDGKRDVFYTLLVELPHFIMEKKMFRAIKARSEAAAGGD